MWQPEPSWVRLPGGLGSSAGVWRSGDTIVKRLVRPDGTDSAACDPGAPPYWRREADVALSGVLEQAPGLRSPELVGLDEDDEGITLFHRRVEDDRPNGLFVARSLGRFAGAVLADRPWLCRDLLRFRLDRTAFRGGWQVLGRTAVADVADHLWQRRGTHLAALDALPLVPAHGDPVPGNLRGIAGQDLVAIDWATLGVGPVGADLGYWSLSAREDFEHLVDAYLAGLPEGLATREQVLTGARVTAAYTVLGRADWALTRVVDGEGALAAKFRHPSVAPYLLALQDAFDRIEPLIG